MIASLRGFSYRYPGAAAPALAPLDLEVRAGERVWVRGPSGSGKSTALRALAGLLGRHGGGVASGEVRVGGEDPAGLSPAARARRVGFVGQVPGDQLVCGTVADEVAFAPESLGAPASAAEAAVAAGLARVGLEGFGPRDPARLSGGQQQRVAVAAALSGGAPLLVLDEPLAHLDPAGAEALLAALDALAAGGVAIVLAEHRDRVGAWADRIVDLPGPAAPPPGPPPPPPPLGELVLAARGLRLSRGGRQVLDGIDLEVRAGERLAILGPNGAGKSTLLQALAGWLDAGEVRRVGRIVDVPQDPDLALVGATVADELGFSARERGGVADVAGLAAALGLADALDRPPQALSRGQRLRLAVGAAVAAEPSALLLDEPTAGQDPEHVLALLDAIASRTDAALVFATHDLALVRRVATRALCLDRGRVVAEGAPDAVCAAFPGPSEPSAAADEGPRPERVDPRTRLVGLGLVGALAVLLDRPLSLGLLASASAAALLLQPIGRAWRWRALALAAAVVWSTVLSQALFYEDLPRVALLRVGPVAVWREGVLHGLVQSLRLVAVSLAGVAVAASASPDRLFAALVRLRVPYGLGFLAVTALRFVPTFAAEWRSIRQGAARRGRSLHRRAPWAWLAAELRLLRPLVARAVRRARALAEALDARGFDPVAPRRLRHPLRLRPWERAAWALAAVGLVVVAGLEAATALYAADVWVLPGWRGVYGWVRGWL